MESPSPCMEELRRVADFLSLKPGVLAEGGAEVGTAGHPLGSRPSSDARPRMVPICAFSRIPDWWPANPSFWGEELWGSLLCRYSHIKQGNRHLYTCSTPDNLTGACLVPLGVPDVTQMSPTVRTHFLSQKTVLGP